MGSVAHAAVDPQQQMLERLQEQERQRQQQQLQQMLPPPGTLTVPSSGVDPFHEEGVCFAVTDIVLLTLDDSTSGLLLENIEGAVQPFVGQCLGGADVQLIMGRLSNLLIEQGYVTSRVLLPEQDLTEGQLRLLVVPGVLEAVESDWLSQRLMWRALPTDKGALLNLRDIEHALESLSRLPNMDLSLDLKPGKQQGGSVIVGQGDWPRRYRGNLLVDQKYFGSTAHGSAQLGAEWGSPFGLLDRYSLSLNTDLDNEYTDQSLGGSVDYDVSYGLWRLGLGYSRQDYKNTVPAVFTRFSATGKTETGRGEVTRTVLRTGVTNISLSGFSQHSDVRNYLDRSTIQVSSYRLWTAGLRANVKQLLWGRQWGLTLTGERGWGYGPAASLPEGGSVADTRNERWQLHLNTAWPVWQGLMQLRLAGQYSGDQLFALQRFSLANSAQVRGYEDISIITNSAYQATLEYARSVALPFPVSAIQPFLALDVGGVPGASNEQGTVRLASLNGGARWGRGPVNVTMEVARPLPGLSTERSAHDYTLRGNLYVFF